MPVRVLVADDDPWILRMVSQVLGKRGYQVDTASDGEEALEKAIASPPDLLITDVMMPHMDGWTLVKVLRSRPAYAFLPVIFLTALTSDDDRIRGFRLGADDYMAKPFRFEELDLRVERTLGRSRMVEQVAREQLGAAPRPAPPAVTAAASEGSGPHVGLMGRLEQVGLAGVLTLLELERKTGVLVVVGGGSSGEQSIDAGWSAAETAAPHTATLLLRRGRVVSAQIDDIADLVNAACVYHMLTWSGGSFEFTEGPVTAPDQLGTTTSHLLMEGARLIDEATRAAAAADPTSGR